MPIYEVDIDRQVITWDRFTRFIKADSEDEARAAGQKFADEANHDCPDDAGPSNCDEEFDDWQVNSVELADEEDPFIDVIFNTNLEEIEDE